MARTILVLALSASAAVFSSVASSSPARAAEDDAPFTIGPRPAWYLMGGITSGAAVVGDRGGYVGGELSAVRIHEGRFVGLYADGYYDVGEKATYTTGGFELGYKLFGMDGGGALRIGPGRVDPGVAGRVFLTVGIVSVYVRFLAFDADRNEQVVQVGGLFKLPLLAPGVSP